MYNWSRLFDGEFYVPNHIAFTRIKKQEKNLESLRERRIISCLQRETTNIFMMGSWMKILLFLTLKCQQTKYTRCNLNQFFIVLVFYRSAFSWDWIKISFSNKYFHFHTAKRTWNSLRSIHQRRKDCTWTRTTRNQKML
jgi:hypothetical protein